MSSPSPAKSSSVDAATVAAAIDALPVEKVPSWWESLNIFQKVVVFETLLIMLLFVLQLSFRHKGKSHNTSVVMGILASVGAMGAYANAGLFGAKGKVDAILGEVATVAAAYQYLKTNTPVATRAAGDSIADSIADASKDMTPEALLVLAAVERKSSIVMMVCRLLSGIVHIASVITLGVDAWVKPAVY